MIALLLSLLSSGFFFFSLFFLCHLNSILSNFFYIAFFLRWFFPCIRLYRFVAAFYTSSKKKNRTDFRCTYLFCLAPFFRFMYVHCSFSFSLISSCCHFTWAAFSPFFFRELCLLTNCVLFVFAKCRKASRFHPLSLSPSLC